MSSTVDHSIHDSRPVELYVFTQGLKNWYYVNGSEPYMYKGQEYTPANVDTSEIEQTEQFEKGGLAIKFPVNHEFAKQFLGFTTDIPTSLTCYRGQYGTEDFLVNWKGRFNTSKASGLTITLEFESIFTSMKRPGLRARYQRSCRHTLYARGCGVNKEAYAVKVAVQTITSGTKFVVNQLEGYTNGSFTGGIAVAPDGSMRMIANQNTANLTIVRPFHELNVGDELTIYPGCDHTQNTCRVKFNNELNFGGFPHLGGVCPFGGRAIL